MTDKKLCRKTEELNHSPTSQGSHVNNASIIFALSYTSLYYMPAILSFLNMSHIHGKC